MTEFEQYEKLLNSQPENETCYECISISHSKMSKVHNYVIDSTPLTAKNNLGVSVTFEPASIQPQGAQNNNDLDQLATFTIADPYNVLDDELERIPLGDKEDVVVSYYIYVSTSLEAPAEYFEYTVKSIPQKVGAFTLNCGAPNLNKDETGEVYSFGRFPMLRTAV